MRTWTLAGLVLIAGVSAARAGDRYLYVGGDHASMTFLDIDRIAGSAATPIVWELVINSDRTYGQFKLSADCQLETITPLYGARYSASGSYLQSGAINPDPATIIPGSIGDLLANTICKHQAMDKELVAQSLDKAREAAVQIFARTEP